ncbi:hypothetical protein EDD86DRAFT_227847 [Gorgonomyces haynaldii]|nr:hypothetical protein EDD86DRAFT_227847 [Gorgonomyces haynaldii]
MQDLTIKSFRQQMELLIQSSDMESLRVLVMDTFSSLEQISNKFSQEDHLLDILELQHIYTVLANSMSVSFLNATTTLLDHVKHAIQPISPGRTGAFLAILMNPLFLNPDFMAPILSKLCFILSNLEKSQRFEFALIVQESIIKSFPKKEEQSHYFLQLITLLHQFLTLRVLSLDVNTENLQDDDGAVACIQTLGIFSAINETNGFIPFYEFYNESVEAALELKDDYPKWKAKEGFSICNYPFLLSAEVKSDILRIESMIQMRHELQDAFFRAMFIGVNSPYLQLEIRREEIIRDTLYQLETKTKHDLKKQLRVSFVGEEGIDEGGVQKEFFQLVISKIFHSDYGMFSTTESGTVSWFANCVVDKDLLREYKLLGLLFGLAIYNGVILDIRFPVVLYKKLLGCTIGLDDLLEIDSQLHRGLKQLLEFDGDVNEVYNRSFVVEIEDSLGNKREHALKDNGSNISVDNDNRLEYVNLYADFLINRLYEDQFQAFKEGFDTILQSTAITLFRAEELMQAICGSPSLDFEELEKSTKYDGFEADAPVVRYFWEIVKEFTDEQKKQLLFFTTGSDRVPIGGLGKLQFIIGKNGLDSDRVPTSHTCFNVLLLSEYSSKEKLKDRLLTALANCNCGFFLN